MAHDRTEINHEVSGPGQPSFFVGLDLAWHGEGRHSGLAALVHQGSSLSLASDPTGARSDDEILAFIGKHSRGPTVVAIDAPLIITNASGQRPCETRISERFGRNHASAHTSNLTRFPDSAGVRLARELQSKGFSHPSESLATNDPAARLVVEVYPHPAQIRLFDLERILKYKKGRVASRRAALDDYRTRLKASLDEDGFSDTEGSITFFAKPIEELRGPHLTDYDDRPAALFCALLAFRLWAFGWSRNEIIGDLQTGYIVVPKSREEPARTREDMLVGMTLRQAAGVIAVDPRFVKDMIRLLDSRGIAGGEKYLEILARRPKEWPPAPTLDEVMAAPDREPGAERPQGKRRILR